MSHIFYLYEIYRKHYIYIYICIWYVSLRCFNCCCIYEHYHYSIVWEQSNCRHLVNIIIIVITITSVLPSLSSSILLFFISIIIRLSILSLSYIYYYIIITSHDCRYFTIIINSLLTLSSLYQYKNYLIDIINLIYLLLC